MDHCPPEDSIPFAPARRAAWGPDQEVRRGRRRGASYHAIMRVVGPRSATFAPLCPEEFHYGKRFS